MCFNVPGSLGVDGVWEFTSFRSVLAFGVRWGSLVYRVWEFMVFESSERMGSVLEGLGVNGVCSCFKVAVFIEL